MIQKEKEKDTKERNKQISKAYKQDYSNNIIANIFGMERPLKPSNYAEGYKKD